MEIRAVTYAMNFVIGLGVDEKKCFKCVATVFTKAFALCATTPDVDKSNAEIGFIKAVKMNMRWV